MKVLRRGVIALALCAAHAAAADPIDKSAYPLSLIERPLILPALLFQPAFALEATGVPDAYRDAGVTMAAGLDVGLWRGRLQAGVALGTPLHPDADFSLLVANLQIGLWAPLNLRFDVGLDRVLLDLSLNGEGVDTRNGFIWGVGLPFKLKLHRMVALVGQSPSALGFGLPRSVLGVLPVSYGRGMMLPGDLFSMFVADYGFAAGTLVVVSLFVPVGVRVQPIERFSVGMSTGFRLMYATSKLSDAPYNANTLFYFVPLGFDATVTVIRQLDLTFTAVLPGGVSGTVNGYAGEFTFGLFATGHF
jgi:hypothetical protein